MYKYPKTLNTFNPIFTLTLSLILNIPHGAKVIVRKCWGGHDSTIQLHMQIKLLCPRGTQTCALAVANIAHAVYLSGCHSRSSHQV